MLEFLYSNFIHDQVAEFFVEGVPDAGVQNDKRLNF